MNCNTTVIYKSVRHRGNHLLLSHGNNIVHFYRDCMREVQIGLMVVDGMLELW